MFLCFPENSEKSNGLSVRAPGVVVILERESASRVLRKFRKGERERKNQATCVISCTRSAMMCLPCDKRSVHPIVAAARSFLHGKRERDFYIGSD